ncbi:BTAD domain-containing putative transcriptional regulator [Georgenia subflava]|uniref:Transcriptional activator domain-containing protein n=1 Tax=Georgenia subflava TaxID=1622177 RepID=A0A6N7EH00_9MICO|nr:BTAD domain-containing putative transcriptional regulator [Georgenia subflava]MPV37409.1 transcriptional activator domain-containing protein [Georgenia subflava]
MDGVPLSIHLLGDFSVTVGGRPIPDSAWHRRKATELVKLLVLAPRHRLPREQVMEALWPEGDPDTGGARVRKAAFHARRLLGVPDGVVLADGSVALAPGHRVRSDVADFTAAATAALRDADETACRTAAALYGGDLLPEDPYAPWCDAERDRLRSLYLRTLAGGRLWGRLVVEDPTDERAHREIIRAHLADGDRSAAIRQFGELRTALRTELGISPGRETVAVYEQVLAMDSAPAPTPAERARALLVWAAVHRERADLAEAERTALEVRALAVDAGLAGELTEASEILGLVAYARGSWQEDFAREFLATLTSTPELAPFLFDANMCMSEFALGEQDGTDAVGRLAEQMIDDGERLAAPQARALGLLLRGEAGLLADDDPARVHADLTVAERSWPADAITGRALSAARLAHLAARQHDHDAAGRAHRRALGLARRSAIPEHLLPCVYGGLLESAPPGQGAAVLAEAEAEIGELAMCEPCAMALRVAAARVCAQTRETARGRIYLADAERVSRMWTGGPWHAAVLEARAHLDHADGGDVAVVAGLLERAATGFEAAGRPREATRCRRAAARWSAHPSSTPGAAGNAAGTAAS